MNTKSAEYKFETASTSCRMVLDQKTFESLSSDSRNNSLEILDSNFMVSDDIRLFLENEIWTR